MIRRSHKWLGIIPLCLAILAFGCGGGSGVGGSSGTNGTTGLSGGTTGELSAQTVSLPAGFTFGGSSNGATVGYSAASGKWISYYISPNGNLQTLSNSGPAAGGTQVYGVNASGQIVGIAVNTSTTSALYWPSPSASPVSLTIPAGAQSAKPTGINNGGEIVGQVLTGSGQVEVVYWTSAKSTPVALSGTTFGKIRPPSAKVSSRLARPQASGLQVAFDEKAFISNNGSVYGYSPSGSDGGIYWSSTTAQPAALPSAGLGTSFPEAFSNFGVAGVIKNSSGAPVELCVWPAPSYSPVKLSLAVQSGQKANAARPTTAPSSLDSIGTIDDQGNVGGSINSYGVLWLNYLGDPFYLADKLLSMLKPPASVEDVIDYCGDVAYGFGVDDNGDPVEYLVTWKYIGAKTYLNMALAAFLGINGAAHYLADPYTKVLLTNSITEEDDGSLFFTPYFASDPEAPGDPLPLGDYADESVRVVGVDEDGNILGVVYPETGEPFGIQWASPTSNPTALPDPPGSVGNTPNSLSNGGSAAGEGYYEEPVAKPTTSKPALGSNYVYSLSSGKYTTLNAPTLNSNLEINSNGQIVGNLGYFWSGSGASEKKLPLSASSYGYGQLLISNYGIAGTQDTTNGPLPTIWSPTTGAIAFTGFAGAAVSCINDSGMMGGFVVNTNGIREAVIMNAATSQIESVTSSITTVSPPALTNVVAIFNDNSVIAEDEATHAFYYLTAAGTP